MRPAHHPLQDRGQPEKGKSQIEIPVLNLRQAPPLAIACHIVAFCRQTQSCAIQPAQTAFTGQTSECASCHLGDYDTTQDPGHMAAGFPTTCEDCHSAFGWEPASFGDHNDWFPLEGKHNTAACTGCHKNGVYEGTPKVCVECHLLEYEATDDPDHAAAGFPQTCEDCHTASGWSPAAFGDHDEWWPLNGKHETTSCEGCHAGGVFEGTPRTCDGCHMGDFQATTDPNHPASDFPTTCETCHSESAWTPASFGDHDDFWPLTGKHETATCGSCHIDDVYEGTPTQCNGCHTEDYVATNNPDHASVGMGTGCDTCHGTSNWDSKTFPGHNPLFPITSGDHKKYTCAQCHKTPTWSDFTCIGCHTGEHTLSRMNGKHDDVSKYASTLAQYSTKDQGCLKCHPDGEED